MSETAQNVEPIRRVSPVTTRNFGAAEHRYKRFDATVPADTTPEELQSPDLWTHIAPQVPPGSEIRVVADDYSWVAYLFVTYSMGTNLIVRLVHASKMDTTIEPLDDPAMDYEVKLCGPKKYCIRKKSTGEIFKEGIATQIQALQELEDYVRALRS